MLQRKSKSLYNSILSLYAQQLQQRQTKIKVKQAQAYLKLKKNHTSNKKTLLLCKRKISQTLQTQPEIDDKFSKVWLKYNTIQQIQMLQKLKQKENRIGMRAKKMISQNKGAVNQSSGNIKRQKKNLLLLSDANKYLEQVRQLRHTLIKQRQYHQLGKQCRKVQNKQSKLKWKSPIKQDASRKFSRKITQYQEQQPEAITKVLQAFNIDEVYARLERNRKKKYQESQICIATFTNASTNIFKSKSGLEKNNEKFALLKTDINHGKKLINNHLTRQQILYQSAANKCLKYWNNKKREQKMEIKTFKKLHMI